MFAVSTTAPRHGQFKATVWPKVASESTYEAQKFQNFMREHPPDPLLASAFRTASGLKLGGAWVRGYSQTQCAHAVPWHRLCSGYATVFRTPSGTKILSVIVRCPKLRGFWYNFGRCDMRNQAVDYNVTAFWELSCAVRWKEMLSSG